MRGGDLRRIRAAAATATSLLLDASSMDRYSGPGCGRCTWQQGDGVGIDLV